jgi:multidrug efflux pump subunit AcrA (membrane-fusion protein)
VVAQVEDPYGRSVHRDRPPLAVGLFVEAEILGRVANGVVRVPRSAMRTADQLLVVDEHDELKFRRVGVLRADGETVIIDSGITEGERICISPLEAAVDGMTVRVLEEEASETEGETVASR